MANIPYPEGFAYAETDWGKWQAEMQYHIAVQLARIADGLEAEYD